MKWFLSTQMVVGHRKGRLESIYGKEQHNLPFPKMFWGRIFGKHPMHLDVSWTYEKWLLYKYGNACNSHTIFDAGLYSTSSDSWFMLLKIVYNSAMTCRGSPGFWMGIFPTLKCQGVNMGSSAYKVWTLPLSHCSMSLTVLRIVPNPSDISDGCL